MTSRGRRKQMIGIAAEERKRVQKVLEDAHVKIGDVLTDVFGLSGQLMLEALVNGLEGTPQPTAPDIAQLARGQARKKVAERTAALEGHQMRNWHRMLIRHAMRHLAFLAAEIENLGEEIATMIRDSGLTAAHELHQTIPGIRTQAAATILSESGPDMKQFPAVTNFSSWTGLAPGNNESAGKNKRAPALQGNPHIKIALVEAAWAAARASQSEFESRYQRLKPRTGPKRAIVATAHTLAIRVYEVLDSGQPQAGGPGLSPQSVRRLIRHHTRRLNCFPRWLNNKGSGAK